MANNENKATKPAETVMEDRVEVFVPKGYANDDPNLFVSVNGVNYLLPKGKKSQVPAHVAAEIERSKRAAEKQDEKMEQMLEASK
jgi:ribosomal protein L9